MTEGRAPMETSPFDSWHRTSNDAAQPILDAEIRIVSHS